MLTRLVPVLVISLFLTLVFEVTYALIWGVRGRHDLWLVILVNILTNPIVVFVHYWVMLRTGWNVGAATLLLEAGAILTEGVIYWKCGKNISRPMLFSLSVNMFSYAVGELINAL